MTTVRRQRPRINFWVALSAVALILLAILCLVPLLWLIIAPSKTDTELANWPALAFGNFAGYVEAWGRLAAFQDGAIYKWLWNTVLSSALIIVFSVLIAVGAGYALAVTRMRGRRAILVITLICMIMPGGALVIAQFLTMSYSGLLDTIWSYVLPCSLFPFGVYLSFIHFSSTIPPALYESARIDGASEIGIFIRIALPLSKALLGLLTFFCFVGAWNNYFLPYVMLSHTENFTLLLGLQFLMASGSVTNPVAVTNLNIGVPEAALATIVTVLPVAIVFMFCQRYLARGVLIGATKE